MIRMLVCCMALVLMLTTAFATEPAQDAQRIKVLAVQTTGASELPDELTSLLAMIPALGVDYVIRYDGAHITLCDLTGAQTYAERGELMDEWNADFGKVRIRNTSHHTMWDLMKSLPEEYGIDLTKVDMLWLPAYDLAEDQWEKITPGLSQLTACGGTLRMFASADVPELSQKLSSFANATVTPMTNPAFDVPDMLLTEAGYYHVSSDAARIMMRRTELQPATALPGDSVVIDRATGYMLVGHTYTCGNSTVGFIDAGHAGMAVVPVSDSNATAPATDLQPEEDSHPATNGGQPSGDSKAETPDADNNHASADSDASGNDNVSADSSDAADNNASADSSDAADNNASADSSDAADNNASADSSDAADNNASADSSDAADNNASADSSDAADNNATADSSDAADNNASASSDAAAENDAAPAQADASADSGSVDASALDSQPQTAMSQPPVLDELDMSILSIVNEHQLCWYFKPVPTISVTMSAAPSVIPFTLDDTLTVSFTLDSDSAAEAANLCEVNLLDPAADFRLAAVLRNAIGRVQVLQLTAGSEPGTYQATFKRPNAGQYTILATITRKDIAFTYPAISTAITVEAPAPVTAATDIAPVKLVLSPMLWHGGSTEATIQLADYFSGSYTPVTCPSYNQQLVQLTPAGLDAFKLTALEEGQTQLFLLARDGETSVVVPVEITNGQKLVLMEGAALLIAVLLALYTVLFARLKQPRFRKGEKMSVSIDGGVPFSLPLKSYRAGGVTLWRLLVLGARAADHKADSASLRHIVFMPKRDQVIMKKDKQSTVMVTGQTREFSCGEHTFAVTLEATDPNA